MQHGAVPCTVFTVYYDSVHFLVALRDQVVANAVPTRMTLVPYSNSAHITLMAEQRSTLVVRCCQAGAASQSAVLHKESLGLWVYISIYTTPYTIAWWCVAVLACCRLHGGRVTARFAATFSLGLSRLPGSVVKRTRDYYATLLR